MKRGSTWNRWDLHTHSPASYEGDFGSPAEDDTWREYTEALISAIQEHEVCAISIQDYFTTKGYEELIERNLYDPELQLLHLNGNEVEVLIIPGMEIRLSNFVGDGSALNAHLYFDPTLYSRTSVRDFLGYVNSFQIGSQKIKSRPRNLIEYELSKYGDDKLKKESLSKNQEYEFLHRAAKEASVPLDNLDTALEKHQKDYQFEKPAVLVALAGSGHGAISELGWDGRKGPVRKQITRMADMILSSNEKDRLFYLGQHKHAPTEVLKDEIGGLKPCIWGSDAHDIGTLLHPSAGDTKRYTWIKAEPTFEGLRQIQFEPGSRVVIQEEHPQPKSQYRTIQRISLSSGDYANCEVCFNHDLSVIIGGKSTGKSLLLYAVAATMDEESATNRHPDVDSTTDWYNRVLSQSDAKVCWDDGQEFRFGGKGTSSRAISYIPQSYINRLAEDPEELNSFVLDVLTEKERFRQRREQLRRKTADQKQMVQAHVRSLNELIDKERELQEELRGLGDKQGIESEIERLKDRREELTERSGLSDEERNKFDKLKEKRNLFSDYRSNQLSAKDAIDDLEGEVEELGAQIKEDITSTKELINQLATSFIPGATGKNHNLAVALDKWLKVNEEAAAQVLQATAEVRDQYVEVDEDLRQQKEEIDGDLEPLESKLELREELERVESSLQKEKNRLSRLEEINENLADLGDKREHEATRIAEAHATMYTLRQEGAEELRDFLDSSASSSPDVETKSTEVIERSNNADHSLEVIVDAVTEGESLAGRINDMLDGRRSSDESLQPLRDANDTYKYEGEERHVTVIKELLLAILEVDEIKELGFKEGYDFSKVIDSVTDDWFAVRYSLSYEGEPVTAMSPGKRGMVLLQFLLERSDAEYPILLDQPEDNLDNRTIFDHVVTALRLRKTERQIIVVTHNPNLVVATDAEQVVVAKQATDQEMEGGADRFQYASGALESSRLSRELDEEIESVRDWVCEILEGGPVAFKQRQTRYNLPLLQ